MAVFQCTLIGRLVEINRWLFELIKHENNRAEQQNEKLHRHLDDRVEKQSETTLFERAACEISLHLRLICSEIRQREKKAANQARPESVTLMRIDRETDRLQFVHFARD